MISRRMLLASLAAASCAPRAGAVMDTHTHFYDPTRPQGVPWPPAKDELLYRTVLPEEFVTLTRPLGVEGTVVVEASAWVEDNAWVLELARRHPVIRGLVGRLEPGTSAFAAQLERFRKDPLFLGIRVGWGQLQESLERPPFLEDMKRLADAGLSLDTAGGGFIVEAAARLTDAVPTLRVVLDHLPFEKEVPLSPVKGRPGVYAKVSNFWNEPGWADAAARVLEVFGEDRVIFGSNWPVSLRQGAYAELLQRARGFIAQAEAGAGPKYFRENGQRAYGWK
ncbi:MAG: amidohydrolase family protein [Bryobacteraceae bacterium]|nr:amidohydrolase family protein [Bryobacteraceae bacterium]